MEKLSKALLRQGVKAAFGFDGGDAERDRPYAEAMIRTSVRNLVFERADLPVTMVEHVTIGCTSLGIWTHPEAAASTALVLLTLPGLDEIPYIRHIEDAHPTALVTVTIVS